MGGLCINRRKIIMRSAGFCLSAVALLALGGPKAEATYLTKNLQLCDEGDFFVGGVPKTTKFAASVTPSANYAQITVGQMYVEFQVPVAAKKWPIIVWHGSTHSGACVKSTPQGTEGWAPYLVHNGLATYVVDQAGRGRSGNDNSRIHEAAAAAALIPLQTPRPLLRISAVSPITAPIRLGSATSLRPAPPRHAQTSPHANSSRMDGGPTIPQIPMCIPAPLDTFQLMRCPHMAYPPSSNLRT